MKQCADKVLYTVQALVAPSGYSRPLPSGVITNGKLENILTSPNSIYIYTHVYSWESFTLWYFIMTSDNGDLM